MTILYDWSRWFPTAAPAAPVEIGLIPARTRHPAEIVNVRFVKTDQGLDRVFTFRITSGKFNNHEVNYRVKATRPGKLKPLLDVVMPSGVERADMIVVRNANVWLKHLKGRAATIVVDVFKEWNYIADILP